jgi:hypothetical protein
LLSAPTRIRGRWLSHCAGKNRFGGSRRPDPDRLLAPRLPRGAWSAAVNGSRAHDETIVFAVSRRGSNLRAFRGPTCRNRRGRGRGPCPSTIACRVSRSSSLCGFEGHFRLSQLQRHVAFLPRTTSSEKGGSVEIWRFGACAGAGTQDRARRPKLNLRRIHGLRGGALSDGSDKSNAK